MKNCELFTTEEKLQEKWELRQKLAPNTPDGITYTKWACYNAADLALQDKFLKPGLFIRNGEEYVLVNGPQPDKLQDGALVYVSYTDEYGPSWDHADHFKQARLPAGILDLAKALVLGEIRAKCPLLAEVMGNEKKESAAEPA